MQLTLYSDYSLRVLIYLALRPQEVATITEISDAYGVSRNHLVKVVHNLALQGFIKTSRGKFGGMWLDKAPEKINVADVVRHTEPNFHIVECFSPEPTCPIAGICTLQNILGKATKRFMKELELYTLADLVKNKRKLEAQLVE